MKFEPLYDRILVERESEEVMSSGGIIIPDTSKDKPQQGRVMAVGAGRVERGVPVELSVKAGDSILFGRYAGTEIKLGGKELLIMKEEEVLGILRAN